MLDFGGAIADFNRAIELDPKNTGAVQYRNSIVRRKRTLDEAKGPGRAEVPEALAATNR